MCLFLSGCSTARPDPLYILHAGGVTPDGISGSNSLEALDHSYENGYRIMEIDFCWTEDDQLVCIHDWDAYYARMLNKERVTMEEFEQLRYGTYGFTSMTLADLAPWMEAHEDAAIVTDIKERSVEGFRMIAEQYPHLQERFWVQIYHPTDYDTVRELGFENIILTIYQMTWEEKQNVSELAKFARTHTLKGLTYPIELHDWFPEFTPTLLKTDTPLFIHTVNDPQQQQELFALGISGIYTDTGGEIPTA